MLGDGIIVNNKYLSQSESQSLPCHHYRADYVVFDTALMTIAGIEMAKQREQSLLGHNNGISHIYTIPYIGCKSRQIAVFISKLMYYSL